MLTSFTSTEDRFTDTTIPETTKNDIDVLVSSSGTTALQETTHIIQTTTVVSSSPSTSTTTTLSSTSTTRGTTVYVPSETTIPYTVKETSPPEPSTPEHDIDNEVFHPEPHPDDYYDPGNNPEPPMPEPQTDPPLVFRTPPPFISNAGIYNTNPTRPTPKNKHGRINTEAEERTAMIIGIVAGALIAVILVILLVLWIKSNGDRSYKMEHDLKYGHGANAALLGAGHNNQQQQMHQNAGHHNNNGQQPQNQQYGNNAYNQGGALGYDGNGHHSSNMSHNGSLRQSQNMDRNGMSAGLVQPKTKRNSKDIKEWYV